MPPTRRGGRWMDRWVESEWGAKAEEWGRERRMIRADGGSFMVVF
jgi:hypothetical protein